MIEETVRARKYIAEKIDYFVFFFSPRWRGNCETSMDLFSLFLSLSVLLS